MSVISEVNKAIQTFEKAPLGTNYYNSRNLSLPQVCVIFDDSNTAEIVELFLKISQLFIDNSNFQESSYIFDRTHCCVSLLIRAKCDNKIPEIFLQSLKKSVKAFSIYLTSNWQQCSKEEILSGPDCLDKCLLESQIQKKPNTTFFSKKVKPDTIHLIYQLFFLINKKRVLYCTEKGENVPVTDQKSPLEDSKIFFVGEKEEFSATIEAVSEALSDL